MGKAEMRPSIVSGLRSAWRLRWLVVVIWLAGFAVAAPALLILDDAVGPPLSRLPSGTVVPDGEVAVLAVDALMPAFPSLWIAIAVMILLSWAFTILWHAGAARFEVWGSGPPAVSKVLGLGLTAWWPYFRLAATSVCVLVGLMGALWTAVAFGVTEAFTTMAEERMVMLIGLAVVAAAVIKLVVWAATLRGAWELASPTSRSAVRAWVRGLAGTCRYPITTFRTVLSLGTAVVACATAPVAAPVWWPLLRGTSAGVVLGVVAGLGAAFSSVALYTAFAPIMGLMTTKPASNNHSTEKADVG